MEIKVNKQKIIEKIKPMHATGGGPMAVALGVDSSEMFKEIGTPYCRLHDVEHPYGGNQFVDIHCIFPNFDAVINTGTP